MTRLLHALAASLLLACGAQTIRVPPDQRGEAPEEGEPDEGEAVAEAGGEQEEGSDPTPLSLGEPVDVPGTGVTIRPPRGASPMPFLAGFYDESRQIQISVMVEQGPEDILEAMRSAGQQGAPTPEQVERVTIDGVSGRVGYDRLHTDRGDFERVWLLIHDGDKALGIIATYGQESAEAVRDGLLEALRGARWNRETPIDAAQAIGLSVGPVEGLQPSHASTSRLILLPAGASYPPESPTDVVVAVAPLFPLRVPADQVAEACTQLMDQLVNLPPLDVEHEGAVEDGSLPGCERLARIDTPEGDEVAAYGALVFFDGTPILVTGRASADEIGTWQGRFFAAARSVRVSDVRPMPDS
ncbi:MAG: hypothetical protein ACFCGT_00485 [Sandaracinaceae bacterium]